MRSFCCTLLILLNTALHGQIITTVAGNGTFGYSGDGGPALNAQLSDMYYTYPAFDHAGNMYIVQSGSNTIRKVDAAGIITTIAGQEGVIGYSGDGGPAVNALLYHPASIAVDNANNIYFADQVSSIIRKIDATGIITTVSGMQSDKCGTGDNGLLAAAQFRAISGLTTDAADNLYISDYGCNVIRKVNSSNGIVTTIAGNGTRGYSGDGGPATQAQLAYPCKVAVDAAGNVYIPDAQNHRIRKVSPAGIFTTIAGTGTQGFSGDGGPAVNAEMAFPGSAVIDNAGNLYFGDYNQVIRKIDGAGIITTYGGNGTYGYSGDGGLAVLASIALTEGRISIDYSNNIFLVNDLAGNVIRKISFCNASVISQQPVNDTLCNTGDASFFVDATNVISYQWQVNDGTQWTNIADNGIYNGAVTNTLQITGADANVNDYKYRCLLINNCGGVFSAAALLHVSSPGKPTISITAPAPAVCEGTAVSFTAIVTNEGSAPVYQWEKNGVIAGVNSNIYTDAALNNADDITCTLISSEGCLTSNNVVSNLITMTVNPAVLPAISITPSANGICSGTPVTFTSTVSNGGAAPVYTWFKNNVELSASTPEYSDASLSDGDIIMCALRSSLSCISAAEVKSDAVEMNVSSLLVPSVSIVASANEVCKNADVIFTASAVNGGDHPVYQWEKNQVAVGAGNDTYTDHTLTDGDIIICKLMSNERCITEHTVSGNPVRISVYDDPVVTLDKNRNLCEGGSRVLDAGIFSSYEWTTGATSGSITVTGTGVYSVTVTDQHGCKGTDYTDISVIRPLPKNFLPGDKAICPYDELLLSASPAFNQYRWSTGSSQSSITVSNPGLYWLEVQDNYGCVGKDSIVLLPKDCPQGFFMPNAFTPNNDGKNDNLKPVLLGNVAMYQFRIYNRWGQIIFSSSDITKSWDGTFNGMPQEAQVYIWTCSYQFSGQAVQHEKGTVMLIK